MSATMSPSSGRLYGVARVTRVWGVARATLYRQRQLPPAEPPARPGPKPLLSDDALAEAIRGVFTQSGFHGEGYRKAWARLRMAGVRTTKRRVLRVMREHDLLAPTRVGRPRGPRTHDGTILTDTVDDMWGTDLTATWTGEGLASVFIAVDHCSAECIGIHAAKRATRFEALEPIRQGVKEIFGAFAKDGAQGLTVRHDHGSQYVSNAFQGELAFLGIKSSPSFIRAPEGNGCAERFIRTLKENLLWIQTFDTIEDLRLALLDFKRRYNETWLIQRHGWKTPASIRARQQPANAITA